MGSILSLPASFASAISTKGGIFWLRYWFAYFYLALCEKCYKKRLDLYDYEVVGKPEVNGFFANEIERILDPPSKTFCFEKNSDEAFIQGTNSKSEYIAAYIRRLADETAQCSIVFGTADGKSYILPEEHTIQKSTSEHNTFGSSRMKLQCLSPMRKWRIFFNGIMKEQGSIKDENLSTKYVHVKLTLIWTASSEIFDFSSDLSKNIVSDYSASFPLFESPVNLIKKLNSDFDCYEQPGMILGTFCIENEPEKELYLWGSRRRFRGRRSFFKDGKSTEIYGNFKNGIQVHIGVLRNADVKSFVYGYIMRRNGFIYPVDEFRGDFNETENGTMNIKIFAGKKWYDIKVNESGSTVKFLHGLEEIRFVRTTETILDGKEGKGFIFIGNDIGYSKSSSPTKIPKFLSFNHPVQEKKPPILCIPFENPLCQKPELSGGKGASLGILFTLSLHTKDNGYGIKFLVPNGLVISTHAYKEFIKSELEQTLQQFQRDIWSGNHDNEVLCSKMVKSMSETIIPEIVSTSIIENLKSMFGDLSHCKFAVRSSAVGEDTEQMSAAGQMETYLGVKGEDEILNAVRKCWASQFSFQAVEYKRGYGQLINTPMAIVIQEMVSCEVAGVMFSCDPVTGNPSFISITANWGLGESVVSAAVDPDTITLARDMENNIIIHSKAAGSKQIKIVMDDSSGTKESHVDDEGASGFCINEDMALKLGKIAVEIEKYYGNPRDIEWGFANGNVYLFQSRPVTSLDMDTDFETKHTFDTFQRIEKSYWSRANVGEVMPGACSPLGLEIIHRMFDVMYRRRTIKLDEGLCPQKPYFEKGITYCFNHAFINMLSGFRPQPNQTELQRKCFISATFGRLSDDKGLKEEMKNNDPLSSLTANKITLAASFFVMAFCSGFFHRKNVKRLKNFCIKCDGMDSAQLLQKIGENYEAAAEALSLHLNSTFSSIIWNVSILMMLAKIRGDCDNVAFSDFAYLLSTCKDVESASIPDAIQELESTISKEIDPATFKNMSIQDALKWLDDNLSESGMKFKEFLERHGHRSLKEFDVYTEMWNANPAPIVSMLQQIAGGNTKQSITKDIEPFSTIVSKLQVKLGFWSKLRLRWLLPHARRGVREREDSKSLYILLVDKLRQPFHKLAEAMVAEGRIPRKELLFFLCVEEIQQLIETRSPRLITRAIRRFRVHEELDKLVFPEICDGIPKPINYNDMIPITGSGYKMAGVPVSQGVVKATARVVMNLEEAKTIQHGDILITYSTDIGWSPYFTLLSGVATELGGIVSHGAVVAREYGLPCVISLHGATRMFKSGDMVILDGTKGTLQKAKDE